MKAATEKQITIAAKLYEARDAMVGLFGKAEFLKRVNEAYRPAIERAMAGAPGVPKSDVLTAAMHLAKCVSDKGAHAGIVAMILATAVEMVEPTTTSEP